MSNIQPADGLGIDSYWHCLGEFSNMSSALKGDKLLHLFFFESELQPLFLKEINMV